MKVRGYAVQLDEGSTLYAGETVLDLFTALEQVVGIDDLDIDSVVTIEVIELDSEDIEKMPDFDGF